MLLCSYELYCSLIYGNESNGWESVHNLSSLVEMTTRNEKGNNSNECWSLAGFAEL
jgi:hypothetical protein